MIILEKQSAAAPDASLENQGDCVCVLGGAVWSQMESSRSSGGGGAQMAL